MSIETPAEQQAMERVGRLVAETLAELEPMIGLGRPDLVLGEDGWTIATADGSLSAHVEHTVAVRRGGGHVLTAAA